MEEKTKYKKRKRKKGRQNNKSKVRIGEKLKQFIKSSDISNNAKFNFRKIPECPVFRPTEEEFREPLIYLRKIYPSAVDHGICKIVPPSNWIQTDPACFLERKEKFETKKQFIHRLQEGYGHDDGHKYTPLEYKKMADRFYSKFIRTISTEKKLKFSNLDNSEKTRLLEAKYWQTVQNGKKCEVEYGSDVTPDTVTSGFAGENRLSDENPLKTGWNLRKLPSSKGSLLKHLDEKVSGVNDPWIYFGMLFSSFCWHYEDDSLFSISYNHTGATKLWYGVPGKMASSVEGVFEDLLPELFEEEPDIMMKLVTMISPSVLRAKGIPVVRSEHRAGEFMVTLPNAFHGGFNAGFNVAEAVNFALESWLPEGLRCADRYSTFRRESVLSHERIVLKTAEESDFDAAGAQFVLEALQMILSREKKLRPEFEAGEERLKTRWERHGTESEITQCSVCERKCYLSFVLCNKHQGRVGCLEHAKSFCRCGSNKRNSHRKSLKCSYSIGELESLFSKVEKKVNSRLT